MAHRRLIPLATVLLLCAGTVAVAHAATGRPGEDATTVGEAFAATAPANPGPSPTAATTESSTSTQTPGFPDASNTGVPAGTALSPYTGSCTITSTVTIDAKTLDCPGGVSVRAAGVVISNSEVNGRILVDTDEDRTWSLTLTDSEVDAGTR